jgi:hypothetical protein
MGTEGPYASIPFGPLAQMLLDATHGPELDTTCPTSGTMNEGIDFRSGPVFLVGVCRQTLFRNETHVTVCADKTLRMNNKRVPQWSHIFTLGPTTPI